jgi:small GTP-binding protein
MALRASASITATMKVDRSDPTSTPPLPKVIVIGDMGVGKTDLLWTGVHSEEELEAGRAPSHTNGPTTAFDFFPTTRRLTDNRTIRINFIDTAGQERFRILVQSNYRDATAFVMVYDITDAKSFLSLKEHWYREAWRHTQDQKPRPLWFLVGTKTDRHEERQVEFSEGSQFAATIDAFFFETNTREGNGARARVTLNLIAQTLVRNGVPCDSERASSAYRAQSINLRGASASARKKSKCKC